MANSKYEYVRQFELPDLLLPQTHIVVRIDGRSFHKLSSHYDFAKPNDLAALELMNLAAQATLRSLPHIHLAYGCSDEYSFHFHKSCKLFERRSSKLVSTVVSTFTAAYIHLWSKTMGDKRALEDDWLPSFDGRAVMLPNDKAVRDYFSWRQVDCHINNLYNTTFWALVQRGGRSPVQAEQELAGTVASDKNEILFSKFAINYNKEKEIFKKGSLVMRDYTIIDSRSPVITQSVLSRSNAIPSESTQDQPEMSKTQIEKQRKVRQKTIITVQHVDLIQDSFWERRPWILSGDLRSQ